MKVNRFAGHGAGLTAGTIGVLSVCIVLTIGVRSLVSLHEAREARRTGDAAGEVAALDRVLLEAPPWALPIRRAARRRLEALAAGRSPAAWYATLALITASRGAERSRWQARSLELAGGPETPASPMIPVDSTPPSPVLAAISVLSLAGWIAGALVALVLGPPITRQAGGVAVVCWVLWLLTLAVA